MASPYLDWTPALTKLKAQTQARIRTYASRTWHAAGIRTSESAKAALGPGE